MIFTETKLPGVFVVAPERIEDERGFFARTWCRTDFETRGLNPDLAQCNISFNHTAGTLRGMHYQTPPHAEAKLVRCTQGAIYDVALDVRPESPAFKQWVGMELTAQNRYALYLPEGVAHGFQTLADNSEVFYQMSEVYYPESSKGARWNDPVFGIVWPEADRIISARDMQFPDFGR